MDVLKTIHAYSHFRKQIMRMKLDYEKQSKNAFGSVTLYNWWQDGAYLWFVLRYQELIYKTNKKINFCSVFGYKEMLANVTSGKVFFSGENLHRAPYDVYADYLLTDPNTDLGLGFDYFDDARYMRFPLWILYMFSPTSSRDDIVKRCNELRYPSTDGKVRYCSMVASHDFNDIRKNMVDGLSAIDSVSCAGKYLHNDESLKNEFSDNKINYLKGFYFNICPENSNSYGYVTEKLFEAVSAGCIPVYWGSYNNPEPLIVNQEAVLFWNKDGDNDDVVRQVERLYSHPNELNDFLRQPRLLDGAEDVIWDMFEKLDAAISRLIKD